MNIKPSDIDTYKDFSSIFGHLETGISAYYIVKFCQSKNRWAAFTYAEINCFYKEMVGTCDVKDFAFHCLIRPMLLPSNYWSEPRIFGGGWITEADLEGFYRVTPAFVERCSSFASYKMKKVA